MSKIQLSAYVNFQGRAREAMTFYHEVLGGKLDLYAINEQGVARPAGAGDRVVHSRLDADGALIMGSDGHPKYPAKVGDNMAIALGGADKDRLTRIFNKLGEGGQIKMPFARQPWGNDVGWLTDKFGINWMLNVNKS